MEIDSHSTITLEDEPMELPPGFRFHPTDEELITHYLSEKVLDSNFTTIAIGEADLNKIEPWDLPSQAKMGEKEWYFFVVRDRKYPTGLRTNRATEAGYWKATGKDKEIYKEKVLIGMKKTLVFYTGRAPKGEKTNWVMHEYRLEGRLSIYNLPKTAKNDWVISRVFKKSSGAKKPEFEDGVIVEELQPNSLPPLMDLSPNNNSETMSVDANLSHVTCFSYPSVVENQQFLQTKEEDTNANMFDTFPCSPLFRTYSRTSLTNMLLEPEIPDFQFVDSLFVDDHQSMLKLLIEGNESSPARAATKEEELLGIDVPSSSGGISNNDIVNNNNNNHNNGPFDHDCFWDY